MFARQAAWLIERVGGELDMPQLAVVSGNVLCISSFIHDRGACSVGGQPVGWQVQRSRDVSSLQPCIHSLS